MAVNYSKKADRISEDELLDICCNLIVRDDELRVFQFAHLSAREYLENSRQDYSSSITHAIAAERCLDAVLDTEQRHSFRGYANIYWPVHCESCKQDGRTGRLQERFEKFLMQGTEVTPAFKKWYDTIDLNSRYLFDGGVEGKLLALTKSPPTPLFTACIFKFGEVVDYSIRHCAASSCDMAHSVLLACKYDHYEILETLLNNGARPDAVDECHANPLLLVVTRGNERMAQLLLENEAMTGAEDDFGTTALHVAAERGDKEIVQLLLKHGATVDAVDQLRQSALHVAAQRGHKEAVQLLLKNAATVNATNTVGRTVLRLAAKEYHKEVVHRGSLMSLHLQIIPVISLCI